MAAYGKDVDEPRLPNEWAIEALTFVRSWLDHRVGEPLPVASLSPEAVADLAQFVTHFLHADAIRHGSQNRDEIEAYSRDWIDQQIANLTPRTPRNGDRES